MKLAYYLEKDHLASALINRVRLATHIITKQSYAVKVIDKEKVKNDETAENLKQEISFKYNITFSFLSYKLH